jgi:hypothetical protein
LDADFENTCPGACASIGETWVNSAQECGVCTPNG